jgi:hypothetical protein
MTIESTTSDDFLPNSAIAELLALAAETLPRPGCDGHRAKHFCGPKKLRSCFKKDAH